MSLFETKRSRIFHKVQIFCPVLILAAVCAVFYLGISSIGNEAITQEQASLRQAPHLCNDRCLSPESG